MNSVILIDFVYAQLGYKIQNRQHVMLHGELVNESIRIRSKRI